MKKRWLFRMLDLVPVLLILAVAAVWFFWQFSAPVGTVAVITADDTHRTLSLSQDTEMTVVGRDGLTVTVVVSDGTVSVSHADCPDQVCVRTAAISKAGDTIACVPAGIAVTIDGEADDAPDAVAR